MAPILYCTILKKRSEQFHAITGNVIGFPHEQFHETVKLSLYGITPLYYMKLIISFGTVHEHLLGTLGDLSSYS
jgi:hypothetical protein